MSEFYVLDRENNKIDITTPIGSLPLTHEMKINTSTSTINHLLKFAEFLSSSDNRKVFVAFKKYGYIVELYESDTPEECDLVDAEFEIVKLFQKMKLIDIIDLLNVFVDIPYPILDKFLKDLLCFTIRVMSIDEFIEYFKSCTITSDEEVPDYII